MAGSSLSNTVTILRWVLVVPAAFIGWYVALMITMLIYGVAQRLCPEELMVSNLCTATWFGPFFDTLVIGGASVAAALIVLLPSLVAPARRIVVARLAFTAGLTCAIWMVVTGAGDKWLIMPALIGACLSGAVTLWLLERRVSRRETD